MQLTYGNNHDHVLSFESSFALFYCIWCVFCVCKYNKWQYISWTWLKNIILSNSPTLKGRSNFPICVNWLFFNPLIWVNNIGVMKCAVEGVGVGWYLAVTPQLFQEEAAHQSRAWDERQHGPQMDWWMEEQIKGSHILESPRV